MPRSSSRRNTSATVQIYSYIREKWLPVIATLDSGTSSDWISTSVLERVGTQDDRAPLDNGYGYVDFQGSTFRPSGEVRLTWRGNRSRQTRESWFSVKENAPFDILIGSDFLFSQGIFTFNEAALLFFNRPATQDEEGQMQRSLEQQNEDNQQQISERRGAEAAMRREQRAALNRDWPLDCRSGSSRRSVDEYPYSDSGTNTRCIGHATVIPSPYDTYPGGRATPKLGEQSDPHSTGGRPATSSTYHHGSSPSAPGNYGISLHLVVNTDAERSYEVAQRLNCPPDHYSSQRHRSSDRLEDPLSDGKPNARR